MGGAEGGHGVSFLKISREDEANSQIVELTSKESGFQNSFSHCHAVIFSEK